MKSQDAGSTTGNQVSLLELRPEVQQMLYSQSVREAAPTSNTDLENHLQRTQGLYDTWSHELVMQWARLKRLDAAVVKIFRDYHIDGPSLSTLTIHSLKDKFDVQDFRLRAKVIQAIEFLKDSSRAIYERHGDDDDDMMFDNSLPEYQANE
ncbi:hypothetical protein HDU76_007349 [Blyttiomyces sp. JEL0837]|nr:hypothetical protein HDU76_007349 [Blyttiomyces sp. JEL0837]